MNFPRTILKANNIRAKKNLGQNFLKTNTISRNILNHLSITNNEIILEIGAGLGALTIPASKSAKKIFAIEKDYKLVKLLNTLLLTLKITNVELIHNDILKINFKEIYNKTKQNLIIIGNLPYNISSQVIIKTIQNKKIFCKAVFMLQKELADRICSAPGTKQYGRLSVLLQYHAKIQHLFRVKPSSFFPKPAVESSIIEISFLSKPKLLAKSEILLSSVIKAAFSKRRKTLKNSLSKSQLKLEPKLCEAILKGIEINPSRRAETLSVEEFVLLSNRIYDFLKRT